MITEEEIAQGFKEGIDCAMSTLYGISKSMGITREEAYRLAGCFGIGAMEGSLCGAVSAGFIAIGHKYGNTGPNQMDQKGLVMAKREEFVTWFRERFGDLTCPGVIKLDLRKSEDMKKAQETKILFTFCPKVCKESAEKVISLL